MFVLLSYYLHYLASPILHARRSTTSLHSAANAAQSTELAEPPAVSLEPWPSAPSLLRRRLAAQQPALVGCAPGYHPDPVKANSCLACGVGSYSSGIDAICTFPAVSPSCSGLWGAAFFQSYYGTNQTAALCTFVTGAPSYFAQSICQCVFGTTIGNTIGQPNFALSFGEPGNVEKGTPTYDSTSTTFLLNSTCTALQPATGVAIPMDCAFRGGSAQCAACPAGSHCELNNNTGPLPCDKGYFCPDGTFQQPCAPGSYAAGSATACSPCPAGTYCPYSAMATPLFCSPGCRPTLRSLPPLALF